MVTEYLYFTKKNKLFAQNGCRTLRRLRLGLMQRERYGIVLYTKFSLFYRNGNGNYRISIWYLSGMGSGGCASIRREGHQLASFLVKGGRRNHHGRIRTGGGSGGSRRRAAGIRTLDCSARHRWLARHPAKIYLIRSIVWNPDPDQDPRLLDKKLKTFFNWQKIIWVSVKPTKILILGGHLNLSSFGSGSTTLGDHKK
jgi:hypothetical protein